jgi:cell division septum initiation protein DivIVA
VKELVEDLKIANDNLYCANQMLEKEIEKLKSQLQQKENIIKEVREYINENEDYFYNYPLVSREHLLEILDKENK